MTDSDPDALIAAPRVVLVLSGAAAPLGTAGTPLERAALTNLMALSRSGRVGRLRTIPGHLPADRATAMAALLGVLPPTPIDAAAVVAEARDVVLRADERCTLVRVLSVDGRPAPALEVHRAAQAFRARMPQHRVVGQRCAHELLVVGPAAPRFPQLEGLSLEITQPGEVPAAALTAKTVAIGRERGTLIGVGRLLGAVTTAVKHNGQPPGVVELELRAAATRALLRGAETVIVDVPGALVARRRERRPAHRGCAVAEALERADRLLIGPLWSAAAWLGATLVVTGDLPVAPDAGDTPLRGDVPIVTSAPRRVLLPEPTPTIERLGSLAPPRYSERGLLGLPVVTSPLRLVPEQTTAAPRRFARDPASGRTVPAERVIDQRLS